MPLPSFTVYIDESFFEFWGLKRPTNNFCYLAFGAPTRNLAALDEKCRVLLDYFKKAIQKDLGIEPPDEMKSVLFRRLEAVNRRRIALQLRNVMLALDCFILAEYSEVQGFILEAVRSDLLKAGKKELPENWMPLYDAKRKSFLDDVQRKGLGQAPMLERLISLPSTALAHYLSLRAQDYEVLLDPRGDIEDQNLQDAIRDYASSVADRIRAGGQNNLKSVRVDVLSEQSFGLQIADLLAGELRWWFISHPEFLEYGSGRSLLEEKELKSFHASKTANGFFIKPERRVKIPVGLISKLQTADKSSLFPYFNRSLANKLISCIAKNGEFRHIDIAHRQFIDSPDNA
jgi:hypothetical protein